MPLPTAHRVTTAHLQAAYPFMSEGGLGGRGVYVGQDLFGGAFVYDPWELYAQGVLSNPNALVAGVVGKGKSALIKCVDADTQIQDPQTGLVRTAAEVYGRTELGHVLTLRDCTSVEPAPIRQKIDSGLAETYRVSLRSGRTIVGTANHPLLSPDGWVPIEDLGTGQTCATPAAVPCPLDPVLLTDAEVDFLAVMLAERCYVPGQPTAVRFTTGDPEIVRRMESAGERLGFAVRPRQRYEYTIVGQEYPKPDDRVGFCRCGCGERTTIASVSRPERGWRKGEPVAYRPGHHYRRRKVAETMLTRLGVARSLSKHKVLPDCVYRLPADQLAQFLGVFWMCDGGVGKFGPYLGLASERMVRQIQHLLLRFGIHTKFRYAPTSFEGKRFHAWSLRVFAESYEAFRQAIPLWGEKAERLHDLVPSDNGPGRPRVTPALRARWAQIAKEARTVSGTSLQEVAEKLGIPYKFQLSFLWTQTGLLRKEPFEAFCRVFDLGREERWLLDPAIWWDEVTAVEPVGKRQVYDFSVPPTCNFIANDLVVHNSYLLRQQVFGRRAVVLSPKPGEYDRLAQAMGSSPISLYPGGAVRLNPLDPMIAPSDASASAIAQHRETLLVSLAEAAVRRALEPEEVTACGLALNEAKPDANGVLTLPAVVDALLRPTAEAAQSVAVDVETLARDGRKAGLALRRLVTGDLRGMFDAPTTPGVTLGGPLTVIDLSRMYNSPALGIIMLCANAWQQAAVSRSDGGKWISVSEEAWATLRYTSVARAMQESYKLARSYGVQNIIVLHRLSDLEAAGAAGSEARTLAQGLLEDTETRIVLNQPPGEIQTAVRLLGLTDAEAALLPTLPRGRALWKIADRSFLVDHRLSHDEWPIIDTDARMNVVDASLKG